MLLRYIVSNFGAIGHPIEFSMLPTADNNDERFITHLNTRAGIWKVLKRGAFFGPNASGKSTFIKSLAFAKNYVTREQQSGKSTRIMQFKGDIPELSGISSFQFMFYIDGEVYEYGFSMNRKQICEEFLAMLTEKDFVTIFERKSDESGKTQINLNYIDDEDLELANILKKSIQEQQKNQLFLYKLSENGVKKAEDILSWFKSIQIIFPDTKIQGLPVNMVEDKPFTDFMSNSLKVLDTGVYRISAVSEKIDFKDFISKMDLPENIIYNIEEIKNGIININGRYFIFSENDKDTTLVQIKFEHHLNNKEVDFNIEDESDGTKRLLDILPILFMTKTNDMICFIDELDRSLHTKLNKYFLRQFIKNDDSLSQLVFTAHDVNLIDLELLRQDEIWFVEKNNKGESQIRPLSNFNLKKGQDTIKDYLNGRFGAVPVIREV